MTTNVYIDGFNLYYGALKNNPAGRWLDLEQMCAALLPAHTVKRIRYFTAKVKPQANNPDVDKRQDVYLRALRTLPTVTTHLGRYQETVTRMPSTNPPPATVEVIKREEKGSDVNLATYLLADAFRGDADTFVVITNDSDLKEPMRMVRAELHKKVGLINPHKRQSKALMGCKPTFVKQVRKSLILSSQFPETVTLSDGSQVTRPKGWN
ncbi:NYN domain-containing protein [Rhodococcus hoagii]|nr:NYN domain-containing protein [Prescottella equi]